MGFPFTRHKNEFGLFLSLVASLRFAANKRSKVVFASYTIVFDEVHNLKIPSFPILSRSHVVRFSHFCLV